MLDFLFFHPDAPRFYHLAQIGTSRGESWPGSSLCYWGLIPLFHTGHESPGSPRIDRVRFHYFFFSNRDELRVIPDSDTMLLRIFGGIGSIRLESRKNYLRLENNIRTCCTKGINYESVKNMRNAARIGHKLTQIRDDSTRFARFSLTIAIKKRPVHASGHQFQNECSSYSSSRIDPAT